MASRKKRKDDLDGFSVMKAAQQAADAKKKTSTDPPDAEQESKASGTSPPADAPKSAYTKARRTAMPSVREIICFQCGHVLEIKGKLTQTVCHKCRTRMELKDHTIEGEWSEDVETAGDITIAPDAMVQGGTLTGNNIILEGRVQGGTLRATRSLSLGADAVYDLGDIETLDLVIPAGAAIDLEGHRAEYRNATIYGTLTAKLRLSGLLRIEPGGLFCGEYLGKHLEIEAGGGLKARLHVEP